jgi:multiple sugar transport system permease protein
MKTSSQSWPNKTGIADWLKKERQREALAGYLFILPTVLGYLIFILGPILAAFVLSFTNYDILSTPEFTGLDNFTRMFSDTRLRVVYGNTFIFTFAAVFANVTLGLLLAVALNRRLPPTLRNIFRTAYFFPILVAMIYVSMIWQFWYSKDLGVINYYLGLVGLGPVPWLSSPQWALWSIVLVYIWKNVGFTMMTSLAGLQNIDQDFYEASSIDGAGPVRQFFNITLPLVSPVLLFNLIISFINAFQEFDSMVVLTGGGPGDSSRSIVYYIYEQAFKSFDMGYASAVAITLFIVIMIVTLAQFWLSRRWVHY